MKQIKHVRRTVKAVKSDYIATIKGGYFPGERIKKKLVRYLSEN